MLKQTALILLLTLPAAPAATVPVLVELFTSEGCSSCPPADLLLRRLESEQPVSGAEIIVLSEHVDYWNHLGWRDPFSSPEYSRRQQTYAQRFHRDGPYTPQMVVNGEAEFVGSDGKRARQAIAMATAQAAVPVRLSWSANKVRIEVDPGTKADVYLVTARDEAYSTVTSGENSGRQLGHVSVAGKLTLAGRVTPSAGVSKEIAVPASAQRVIAFVQAPDQGRILGVAMLRQK